MEQLTQRTDLRPLVLVCLGLIGTTRAAPAENVCAKLSAGEAFRDTTIVSMSEVAADEQAHLPAYCEVHATISPVAGSSIGAVYRLPADWNGKVLGVGGGGFAGNVGPPR